MPSFQSISVQIFLDTDDGIIIIIVRSFVGGGWVRVLMLMRSFKMIDS
jgi:hypothetical protein